MTHAQGADGPGAEGPGERRDLRPGLRGELTWRVTPDRTAAAAGHGEVVVFATPQMALLVELACTEVLEGRLPPGTEHVGTRIEVRHLEATPVGFSVTARAELVEVRGRRLTFRAEVVDEAGKVGEALHERVIVDWPVFLARLEQRRATAARRA